MADRPRLTNISVRIYQLLMHVYPVSFRKEYGCEMTRVFREVSTDSTQRHGVTGLTMTWFRVLGDLARSAFHEHLTELQGGWEMKTAPSWATKLLAIQSIACFWNLPYSPILALAAVSTTKRLRDCPRSLAIAGAVLCATYALAAAGLLFSLYWLP